MRPAVLGKFSLPTILSTLVFLCLVGCGVHPPILSVGKDSLPFIKDDGSRESLQRALGYHLEYLQNLPSDVTLTIDDMTYGHDQLLASLEHFQFLLSTTTDTTLFRERLLDDFHFFQAGGRTHSPFGEMLVTGYYEPVLEGSLTPSPPFIYPLYSKPDSLIHTPATSSKPEVKGRLNENGAVVPYWTRQEIEQNNLAKGFELVYLKDPFEAFILHVQGSGKILLRDGSLRSIHYLTDNGREYNSIGKLLVDEKKITLEEASIPVIHRYLTQHPEEQERIFHHNHKYIFFQWEDDDGPYGSLGKPLTPGRSIAIDNQVLPPFLIGFLLTSSPVINGQGEITQWTSTRRFVLPQDTGSAIRGPGRVDIFWGNGPEARVRAGAMKEKGKLYFLLKK